VKEPGSIELLGESRQNSSNSTELVGR